ARKNAPLASCGCLGGFGRPREPSGTRWPNRPARLAGPGGQTVPLGSRDLPDQKRLIIAVWKTTGLPPPSVPVAASAGGSRVGLAEEFKSAIDLDGVRIPGGDAEVQAHDRQAGLAPNQGPGVAPRRDGMPVIIYQPPEAHEIDELDLVIAKQKPQGHVEAFHR